MEEKVFTVSFVYETRIEITVTAKDRGQARELANAEMDAMDDADMAMQMFNNRQGEYTEVVEN